VGPDLQHTSQEGRAGYVERVIRGGFPEAVARTGVRRERFLDSYVADLINRDVIQLSEIERGAEMRALIRLLYLAWLLCVQGRELDEDEEEPPVPSGLARCPVR
jgi:hypothetical protein